MFASAFLHDQFAGEEAADSAESIENHIFWYGWSIIVRSDKSGKLTLQEVLFRPWF